MCLASDSYTKSNVNNQPKTNKHKHSTAKAEITKNTSTPAKPPGIQDALKWNSTTAMTAMALRPLISFLNFIKPNIHEKILHREKP
jgi:hypothetical protein